MEFKKEYWIEELKKEIGLPEIPYEELDQHKVSFGTFFNTSEEEYVNAKEFVDTQLKYIEKFCKNNELQISSEKSEEIDVPHFHKFKAVEEDDVMATLDSVANLLDNIDEFPTQETSDAPNAILLKPVVQTVDPNKIIYFKVLIGNNEYTVAINDYGDLKIQDQIKHVQSTTFFVEEVSKYFLTGMENIISYYQFVTLIEPYFNKQQTLQERLQTDVKTEFDGPKLDKFGI